MAASPPPSDEPSTSRIGLLSAAAGWLVFGGGHLAAAGRHRAMLVGAGVLAALLVGAGIALSMGLSTRIGRRGVALSAVLPLGAQALLPYLARGRLLTAPGLAAALLLIPVYGAVLRSRGSSAPALSVAAFALSALAIAVQLSEAKTPTSGWHLGAVACLGVAALSFRAWHELGDPH
jgi:hypothetical protein